MVLLKKEFLPRLYYFARRYSVPRTEILHRYSILPGDAENVLAPPYYMKAIARRCFFQRTSRLNRRMP